MELGVSGAAGHHVRRRVERESCDACVLAVVLGPRTVAETVLEPRVSNSCVTQCPAPPVSRDSNFYSLLICLGRPGGGGDLTLITIFMRFKKLEESFS